jgi:thiamine kinase-like enzyme
VRRKIYAYIALCGLLWSNWCEYKGHLGTEFGEYAVKQYEFAKEFYGVFKEAAE